MAQEGRDEAQAATATSTATATAPPKRNAQGLILDKDGKPCRTCNSLSAFLSSTPASKSSKSAAATAQVPNDCPPDVAALGSSTWTLLHSIAATYPTSPSAAQRTDLSTFISSFSRLYPCWVCAEDFQDYIKKEGPVKTESRREFGNWLCEAHNAVNVKLGKEKFDCARWEERWRTGWKDGRCG